MAKVIIWPNSPIIIDQTVLFTKFLPGIVPYNLILTKIFFLNAFFEQICEISLKMDYLMRSENMVRIAAYQLKAIFSRADVAHYKILILLKGHFTIYKKQSSVCSAWQFQMVFTILDAANMFARRIPYQGTS